jgi:alpha-mannosidase
MPNTLTRPWEIWLVHHTHVDIGYTEPQEIILRKHAEFVAQALDYCTATDALPPGERFCWTCEVAWTVKAFLARYPERAEEFFRRVREGRIEVTALYLQLTDLFAQELLEETTEYALALGRAHSFEVVTAMNDDVNGWAWGLPDLLATRGVRFMDTAINETRALGVRPRPAMFRWTGPQGGSVLFWHSHGYLCGNGLGLDQDGADERVAGLLRGLEDGGYPHHVVEVRVHGASHDNAPPGLWLCGAVQRWNAAHPAGPRLRLVTAREWFEHAAAQWPVAVTEHRAAWPDWWADGNGSAARESTLVRQAQADLVTLQSLAAATGHQPAADRVERAREATAFFCEHTWGAWCSTDQPESLTSQSQWNTKAGFAYTAAVEARSLVADALVAEAQRCAGEAPGVLVFNPSDQARTDLVELLAADADLGLSAPAWVPAPVRTEPGSAFHLIDPATGAAIPVWREPAIADSARRPAQRMRFLASAVPARGFRYYRVVAGECPDAAPVARAAGIVAESRGVTTFGDCDFAGGAYALGEVIYETIPGPFGREKLCGWGGIQRDCAFKRTSLKFGEPEPLVLPYGAGVRLRAAALPGSLRSLTLEVTFYDALPWVDLRYTLDKVPNPEAEALYVAFPLSPPITDYRSLITTWLDIPGAVLRPGRDQVPGTATDWHSLQHYFAVESGERNLVVASPDIPLVQVNGINTGQWQEALPPHNGLVMSWVMNNYWFTNFPAAQGGGFSWRYRLQAFPGAFDERAADRFARALRQPLAGCVVPVGGRGGAE